MQIKKCACCKSEKILSDFGTDNGRRDKLNPYCRSCVSEKQRLYKEKNLEKVRASKIAYDRRNKEKIKKWRQENAEMLKLYWIEYGKRYRQEFKAETAARSRRQQAARRRAVPGWFDKEKAEEIYIKAQKMRESGLDVEVDHIFPILGENVCGLHWHGNLQILGKSENRSKGNYVDPNTAPLAHEEFCEVGR